MANYVSKLLSLINGVPRTVDFSNANNILTVAGGLDVSGNIELNGSTSGNVILNASAVTSTYTLTLPPAQAASSGYVLSNDGTGVLSWASASAGSVTSVGLSLPSSVFTVTVSPITSSGTLTAVLASQAANTFFAAPNGSSGAPTFRAIVAADIPTLNQNTTGTASNITATSNSTLTTLSSLSLPTSQLTGTIQASNFPALTGDITTTAGSFATSLVATSNSTLTTLSALSLPTSQLSGSIALTSQVSGILPIANGGTGQSTAAAAYNALSPMTTKGDIEYESATNTASRLAIGTTGQVLTVSGSGTPSWASPATSGTVTSVAFADDSTTPIYSISGSPVTSTGTLAITLETQSANAVFAGPASGSAAQPTFRALVAADIPSLSATYVLQSEVGAASGVASLDGSGKVPLSQLPATLMEFKGNWNPNTNTPTLVDGTGVTGYTYWVSAADASPVSGLNDPSMTNFQIGDLVIYNGSAWVLVTPAAGVSSVNGSQGAVTVNAINQLTGDVTTSAASGSQSEAATVAKIQGTTVSGTTGSGNVVFSASPTFTGTITAAASNFSGAISASNFSGSSSGTNTGDVTIGTANGLSLSGQILSLALASGSTNGALDSADWTTFNNKQSALTFGNLTDVGTDGIIVTNGIGAVIGSGTSIAQAQASGSQNGYLSSTDWTTFNNKLTSVLASGEIFVGNGSNVAAAVTPTGDVTISNAGVTTIGAGKVTASKLGTVTDGVTLDQSGAGGTLEIKAAGVSATQLATGAFDQVTIMGGAGTPAYVASSPVTSQMFIAGQTFAANTSYAVRMSMSGDSGFVAGQVVAASDNANTTDNFWVIGIAFSAAGVAQGSPIDVVSLGTYTFGSGDTAFTGTAVAGKPAYLSSAGTFTMTPPSTSGYANFKVGMMETTTTIFVNGQMMGIA
jgi:hypothetical protein